MDDHNIFEIKNFNFNKNLLIEEFNKNKHNLDMYNDPRGTTENWKIVRTDHFEYVKYLEKLFDITCRPRFYLLKANSTLQMHIDFNTLCSINIVLSNSYAPVIFDDGEYYYTECLLNTQNRHGVINGNEDRILFKMSIFDYSYNDVKNKIKKVLEKGVYS